jgi:hypothetical protein
VANTDKDGRFVISTHGRTGENEVFVSGKPFWNKEVEIRIDQDYDQELWHLPAKPFALSAETREMATGLAVRMQLARNFQYRLVKESAEPDTGTMNPIAFYGTPSFILEIDEFIDLPNLEEIFINLVPVVSLVRKEGRRIFMVESDNNATAHYDPLVMIDYIPVIDQGELMDLVPEKIKRIEVINDVYIRGNVTFGGVINILSKQEDLAGIDLPQGSFFFDFQALEPADTDITRVPEPGERIPDTRNTLLWLDNVIMEKDDPVEIRCLMPDQPGDYVVLVRGMSPEGEVYAATGRIRVE